MSTPFPQAGITFLLELAANNNKEWFAANKKRYEKELKAPSRALVGQINERMATIAPRHMTEPAKAISRINRDIRFSKDKTPYNTHVWAAWHLQDAPKGAGAGFYFGFSPSSVGIGAGLWNPDRERLTSLQRHFASHHEEFRALTEAPDFGFEVASKDAYKRVPKPYPQDHPAAEYLKLKGLHVKAELDADLVTSPTLVDLVADRFQQLVPVVDFLNRGVGLIGADG